MVIVVTYDIANHSRSHSYKTFEDALCSCILLDHVGGFPILHKKDTTDFVKPTSTA